MVVPAGEQTISFKAAGIYIYNKNSIKKGRLIEKGNIVVNDEEEDNIDINDINYIIGKNNQNNNDIQLENKLKTIFDDDY